MLYRFTKIYVMCLTLKNPKTRTKVAKEDIVCYKRLTITKDIDVTKFKDDQSFTKTIVAKEAALRDMKKEGISYDVLRQRVNNMKRIVQQVFLFTCEEVVLMENQIQ